MKKAIRIFLFVLIIIGILLLCTQKSWVPKLVDRIISHENPKQQVLTLVEPEPTYTIRLDVPIANQTISNPLTIKGVARGNWFFEASFPVILTNWDGLIIAQGIAKAKSDWMTLGFVPFEANLTFTVDEKAYSNRGALILKKDNPSGLPENDDSLEIPVVFGGVGASANN